MFFLARVSSMSRSRRGGAQKLRLESSARIDQAAERADTCAKKAERWPRIPASDPPDRIAPARKDAPVRFDLPRNQQRQRRRTRGDNDPGIMIDGQASRLPTDFERVGDPAKGPLGTLAPLYLREHSCRAFFRRQFLGVAAYHPFRLPPPGLLDRPRAGSCGLGVLSGAYAG